MSFHGADTKKIKREYKFEGGLIDFSSNINPHIPKCIEECLNDSLESLKSYPDIEYIDIRRKISNHINVEYGKGYDFTIGNIIVGNGATELIFLITRMFSKKNIAVLEPTFSEYERAIIESNNNFISVNVLDSDFARTDIDKVLEDKKIDRVDVIFVCSPNNPDGKLRNLDEIVSMCIENNIYLIVDETFIEFCEDYRDRTALNYEYENIFVIRAITKFYGLPGLRFGYMISRNTDFIAKMWDKKEPWTVNTIAEKVVLKVFDDVEFAENSRGFYKREREFLLNGLRRIDKITVFDTDSAFILFKLNDNLGLTSSEFKEHLILNYGIVVRDASNFNGLGEGYIRVAIKTREDNIKLIKAIDSLPVNS